MRVRRFLAAFAALAVAAGFVACTTMPTSGPVNPGLEPDDVISVPDVSFVPNSPQPDATADQIVRGFIDAATSPLDGWAIARMFLTDSSREAWRPHSGATVYDPETLVITVSGESATVELEATASVDEGGTLYQTTTEPVTLSFSLEQDETGQWRISAAPDGVLLAADLFDKVFRDYRLMYFTPGWDQLVPDVRWFPRSNAAARIARELVEGQPAAWLEPAVVSAFTEGTALGSESVTVSEGVARIALTADALQADDVTVSRMRTQLEASLTQAGVTGVELAVGNTALVQPVQRIEALTADPRALVVGEGAFGYLEGTEVEALPGLSAAVVGLGPSSAVLAAGGATALILDDRGRAVLVPSDSDPLLVDDRPGLTAPTMDRWGYAWTVPTSQPQALWARSEVSEPLMLAAAWPAASQIHALQLSPEGARMLASVSIDGAQWLVVSSVVRDAAGVPSSLGEPYRLHRLPVAASSVAWIDERTVVAAHASGGEAQIVEQEVGGLPREISAPFSGVLGVAAGGTASATRVLSGEGNLYARRGAAWQRVAESVVVLGQSVPGS